jgi:hypothetical protein
MSSANRRRGRRRPLRIAVGAAGAVATLSLLVPLLGVAQEGVDEVRPSPPSIGADVPVTYFAPPPSTDQPHLIGPLQLLRTGPVDLDEGTITLPLYEGRVQPGKGATKRKPSKAKRRTGKSNRKALRRKAGKLSRLGGRTVSSSALARASRGPIAQRAQSSGGTRLWYILTDTSDKEEADALGLLHSAKLKYTSVAQRTAVLNAERALVFNRGAVDFSPERRVEPGTGTDAFPPSVAQPGSVGSRDYSPLVRVRNLGNTVYNAPIVAGNVPAEKLNEFCDGNVDHSLVHDNVVKICPRDQTVTIRAVTGFSFARPILYMSTDANDEVTSALEGVTFAPGLRDLSVGGDDSAFSAIERIFIATNGPTGRGNPQRQGLNSAVRGEGSPLNVFGGIPTVANDYSPLWDANVYSWTGEAIERGYRSRNFEEFRILGLAAQGHITGPNGGRFGSSGIIINCPPLFRFL